MARRRSEYSYTPDPSRADDPITSDEIERLQAANGAGLSSRRALEHFLRRVEITIDQAHDDIRRMHQEVSREQLESSRAHGAPTTLHPADSFRFLSPAEQARVVDGHLQEKLVAIAREERTVRDERQALVRAASQLQWAVSQTVADPSIDATVSARLMELLTLAQETGADLLGSDQPPALPTSSAALPPTEPAGPLPATPTLPPPAAPTGGEQPPAPATDAGPDGTSTPADADEDPFEDFAAFFTPTDLPHGAQQDAHLDGPQQDGTGQERA